MLQMALVQILDQNKLKVILIIISLNYLEINWHYFSKS